jgi:hypothetical protein
MLLKMSCHSEVTAIDVKGDVVLAGVMGQDLNQPNHDIADPLICDLNHTNHFAVSMIIDSEVEWMTYFNVKPDASGS